MIMGLGSLMFALPHFVTDNYLPDQDSMQESMTSLSENANLCTQGQDKSAEKTNDNVNNIEQNLPR